MAWLVGQWTGSGTIQQGPGPREAFKVDETIESKFDGQVLVFEGVGTAEVDGEERIVHKAFAVLSHGNDGYAMKAFRQTPTGGVEAIDARVVIEPDQAGHGVLTWSFEMPLPGGMMEIRFISRLLEDGSWHEAGDMSNDGGKTWMPFFEMTLTRADAED